MARFVSELSERSIAECAFPTRRAFPTRKGLARTDNRRTSNKRYRGFTLLELMASIALLAVLVLVAAPSLTSFVNMQAFQGKSANMQGLFSKARAMAITEKRRIESCWNLSNSESDFPLASNIGEIKIPSRSLVLAVDNGTTPDELLDFLELGDNTRFDISSSGSDVGCLSFGVTGLVVGASNNPLLSVMEKDAAQKFDLLVDASGRVSSEFGN